MTAHGTEKFSAFRSPEIFRGPPDLLLAIVAFDPFPLLLSLRLTFFEQNFPQPFLAWDFLIRISLPQTVHFLMIMHELYPRRHVYQIDGRGHSQVLSQAVPADKPAIPAKDKY